MRIHKLKGPGLIFLNKYTKYFPYFIYLVYGCALAYFTLNIRANVPDETSFWEAAKRIVILNESRSIWHLLNQPNENGYGAIYWIFYALTCSVFKDYSFTILRLLSMLCFLSIPFLYYRFSNQIAATNRHFASLFWLSFPASLWQGKITGPEPFSACIGLLGLLLVLKRIYFFKGIKSRLHLYGFFLIGVSVGIKLNSISILAFAAPLVVLNWSIFKRIKGFMAISLSIVTGFVLSNPIAITNPAIFLNNLIGQAPDYESRTNFLSLFSERWLWDGIYSVGLFNWSCSLPVLIFLLLLAIFFHSNKAIVISFVFSFLVSFVLVSKAQNYFSWYWFSFTVLIPFLIMFFKDPSFKIKYFVFLLISLNFILNFEATSKDISSKFELIENIKESSYDYSCIHSEIDWLNAAKIIDFSEVPNHNFLFHYFRFDESPIENKIVQQRGIVAYRLIGSFLETNSNHHVERDTYLLVGNRLGKRLWNSFDSYSDFKKRFSYIKTCGNVDLFVSASKSN